MMKAKLASRVVVLLAIVVLLSSGYTRLLAAKQALSLAQVQKLVQIHTPDDVVAQEIRSRGLDFTPSPKTIADLQKRGAGQSTLAAIRERIPIGSMEIDAPPGTAITVDGADAGKTDVQGRLRLPEIFAGSHQVAGDKAGYRRKEVSATVAAKETKHVPLELEWLGGYLTVHTNAPGALIDVAGIGQFQGEVVDLKCSPGSYAITATRAGRKPENRAVNVAAGQHTAVDLQLAVDSAYFDAKASEATQRLSVGDAKGAIQIANDLVSADPTNANAQGLLASAYWLNGDAKAFAVAAATAIRGGGPVVLKIAHEHLELSGEAIHPALLVITNKTVTYDPANASCKYHKLVSPIEKVSTIEVTNKSAAGIMVVRHLGSNTYLLHLDFADAVKANKKTTLFFAVPTSKVQRQGDVGFLISTGNSEALFDAAAQLIRQGQ